jgi:ring-1,2-phenylacetyl-CoA epoxidase subunit PaaC
MPFDSAYEAITEENDSQRWAFGTGFTDPLAGVDTRVPSGVDGADLAAYCLMLGDDALIMSHRLQQWLARAPELEEETALANVALDLLGQARLLLSRAGAADGSGRTEDDFAFGRTERAFRNVRLAEGSDGDFAALMARLLVFSTWRLALLGELRQSADPVLAAVAANGVKELAYHRDYAAQWVIRLGDGTDYSHERMAAGLAAVAPLVPELFEPTKIEARLAAAGVAVDPAGLRPEFDAVLAVVLPEATLEWPDRPALAGLSGSAGSSAGGSSAGGPGAGGRGAAGLGAAGRVGVHTEAMGYLLAEMQSVARAMPGATW